MGTVAHGRIRRDGSRRQRRTGPDPRAADPRRPPGPALAVTVLAGLLAAAVDLPPERTVLVVAAVLTGQLSIGWSNDLIDLGPRPRASGAPTSRSSTGALPVLGVARACVARRGRLTRPAVLACGLAAGAVHLVCVAAGWAYNLGLKATAWSWLPVRRGVRRPAGRSSSLADRPSRPAAGVAARSPARCSASARTSLNVLPDLDDDAATGRPRTAAPARRPLDRRWSPPRCSWPASVVIVVGARRSTVRRRRGRRSSWSLALAVVALRRARPGAVPRRDRDRPGGRGAAGGAR